MASTPPFEDHLNLREQIARIDKMQAEITKIKVDTRIAPWQMALTGMGAGAALLAAGAALTQLLAQ